MPVSYDNFVKKPHQKIQYEKWMIDEIRKCSEDPYYFFLNYVKIQHPDMGKVFMKLYPHQKRMLDTIHNNRMTIIKTPRQYGKSSFFGAYILGFACFNSEKTSGLVSNKQSSSIEILDRLKTMYESLPLGIKPGAINYAKTMVSFDNGSRIIASATSKNSFRGGTINGVCLCDEFCHVSKGLQHEFWSSNYPTVSAYKKAKMVLISTPLGMHDLFHTIGVKAVNKKSIFKPVDVHGTEHPERDEEGLEEQKQILGKTLFNQEVMCKFLGSITNTVIDSEVLERLFDSVEDPILYDLNDKLRIGEKPQENQVYIIGNDVAKGTGEHYSTCQILKITSYKPFRAEQVAVYQDNYIDVYKFANLIYRLATYYNNAFVLVENNAEGASIVSELHGGLEYDNLVNEGSKSTQLGIRATTKTKPKAVLAMKKLIENGDVIIRDIFTVNELISFIDKGNNKFGGKDLTDDLVSGLYGACYITEFDVLDEDTEISTHGSNEEEEVGGILSDIEIDTMDYNFDGLDDINI